VALAAEMKLAMAEVYEVATFYHHFDVVKEGETAPPAITVRVCDSIACELAGSHDLLATLPALLGTGIRVPARAVRGPLRNRSCGRRRPESDPQCDRGASRVGRPGRDT
jgi:formate dehydrogenase